ncbi:MAG: hypothetical protein ABEN55_03290, partial [Bradymonadaceae bacterium]
MVGWALDSVLVEDAAPVERKVTALEEAADILAEVDNEVVWDHYAQEISRRLSIEPELLHKYLRRPQTSRSEVQRAVAASHEPLELDPAESALLAVLLEHPDWIGHFLEGGYDIMLASERLADLIEHLQAHYRDHDEIKTGLFLEQLDDEKMKETVLEAADAPLDEEADAIGYYQDCVRAIQLKYAERGIQTIEDRMNDLDFVDDRDEIETLNTKL